LRSATSVNGDSGSRCGKVMAIPRQKNTRYVGQGLPGVLFCSVSSECRCGMAFNNIKCTSVSSYI